MNFPIPRPAVAAHGSRSSAAFAPTVLAPLALLVAGALTSAPSHAEGTRSPSTLILGVGSLPDYRGSDDYTAVPLIISSFSLGRVGVRVEGTEARFDLAPGPVLQAGPLIGFVPPRDDTVESRAVGALPAIDAELELGGYVGFSRAAGRLPEGTLSGFVSARQALSDDDAGVTARARLEYFFAATPLLRLSVDVEASANDDDYAERWFGVDADGAAASGLTRFSASGGARDVGVGVNAILSFSPSLGLYARTGYSRLLGDAADSPVTTVEGDDEQWFGGLGVFWSRR